MEVKSINFIPFKGYIDPEKKAASREISQGQTEVCSKQMAAALAASRIKTSSPLIKSIQKENIEIIEKGEYANNSKDIILYKANTILANDEDIKNNAKNGADVYRKLIQNINEAGLDLSDSQLLKNEDGENIGIIKSENGKVTALGIGFKPTEDGKIKIAHWYEDNSGVLNYYNGAIIEGNKVVSADEKYEILKFQDILRNYTKDPVYDDNGNLMKAKEQREYKYDSLSSCSVDITKDEAKSRFDFLSENSFNYTEKTKYKNNNSCEKLYVFGSGNIIKYQENKGSGLNPDELKLSISYDNDKIKSAIISRSGNGKNALFNVENEFIFHEDGSEVLIGIGTDPKTGEKTWQHHIKLQQKS